MWYTLPGAFALGGRARLKHSVGHNLPRDHLRRQAADECCVCHPGLNHESDRRDGGHLLKLRPRRHHRHGDDRGNHQDIDDDRETNRRALRCRSDHVEE